MSVLASLVLAQSLLQAGPQAPVLEFPEAGLDDSAAYQGYATRFFRDSHRNTFQVYLDRRSGRVVHLWADAHNASAAFTVRDTAGRPVPLEWGSAGAVAASNGPRRIMRHRLASDLGGLEIGWFLLGSMRWERDFQYWGWHRRPFGDSTFVLPELDDLVRSLERLPVAERARHLAPLEARDVEGVRARLAPRFTLYQTDTAWVVQVDQPSVDGRYRMTFQLRGDLRASTATVTDGVVSVRARGGGGLRFDVTATTDAPALTPLAGDSLFNPAFDAFRARQRSRLDSLARRRLDREIRGLELLSSAEKLMAGLPNFATYFGRDGMMAALMLEPIVSPAVQEHVIGSVLAKLAPTGDVSHEEALGGQAVREHAAEYAALIREWDAARLHDTVGARERLDRARDVLADLHRVRENYRMIDDDFQLAVLVDRYLVRPDVSPEAKRAFLSAPGPGGLTRMEGLVRNLALVADRARPYAADPRPTNLVGFLYRDDEGWIPGSWRDSRAGYGNGRFAMDVNVVWVPRALAATERILGAARDLGLAPEDAVARVPGGAPALAFYLGNPDALRAAITRWQGARRHFEVRLDSAAVRRGVEQALEGLPDPERDYWDRRYREDRAAARGVSFLALALDSLGRPIPAANTDPATGLFLGDETSEGLRAGLDVFVRPYPVGLFVEGLGPLVVNDAYADSGVRRRFREDLYHSPRVVWGREVNLLFLGLARQIRAARDPDGGLRRILETTRRAVEASGLRHHELWSYRIEGDALHPVRYGTSSDIQLWNVTDLAVRFLLEGLPAR